MAACECGCGEATRLAPHTDANRGWVRGEPLRFIQGHNGRRTPNDYVVDEATGCWVWQRTGSKGYGLMREPESGRTRHAHRIYFERVNGPVPDGLELDHLCRNRGCVNPAHLEVVTHAENMRRAAPFWVKGMARAGVSRIA